MWSRAPCATLLAPLVVLLASVVAIAEPEAKPAAERNLALDAHADAATASTKVVTPFGAMGMPDLSSIESLTSPSVDEFADLSQKATKIAGAVVETFLHKQHLRAGELDCLVQGSGQLAGNMMMASSHTVLLLEKLLGMDTGGKAPDGKLVPLQGMPRLGKIHDGASSIADKVDQLTKKASKSPDGAEAAEGGGSSGGSPAAAAAPGHKINADNAMSYFYSDRRRLDSADLPSAPAPAALAAPPQAAAAEEPRVDINPPQAPGALYETQQAGTECPEGLEIHTETQCREAVDQLMISAQEWWIGSSASLPRGCSFRPSDRKVHYNTGLSGQASEDLKPVCLHKASTTVVPSLDLSSPGIVVSASAIIMELGFSIQQIIQITTDISKKCVSGDALDTLVSAAAHLRDAEYVSGHFLANGADIVSEMADAVVAYQKGDLTRFGHDLGKAMRKVVLSSGTATLPEGLPGKYVLANVTSGMIKGLFGKGFSVDLTFDADPYNPTHIDLQQCVSDNLAFFQQVWASTMYYYAQKAAEDAGSLDTQEGQVQFGTAMAFTMMELPTALQRCHIGAEQEEMLADSIGALGSGMHLNFHTPNTIPSENQITQDLAQTVKDWSELRWYQFGQDMGKLLQSMVLLVFPQKYSVSSTGVLRRQLVGLRESSSAAGGLSAGRVAMVLLAASAALLVVGALLAVTSRRTMQDWTRQWRRYRYSQSLRAAEACSGEDVDPEVARETTESLAGSRLLQEEASGYVPEVE